MAHVGTSGDLAQQPAATGAGQAFWRAMLALIVAVALGLGLVMTTSFIAGSNISVGAPAPDHRYDQIESLRGGATLPAAGRAPIVSKRVMPGDSGVAAGHESRPDMTGPRRPQATGSWCRMSCSPAQSAGGRSTIAVEAPRRPEPPGAETSEIGYVLAAWTARTAGRRPRIRSIAIATMNPTRTTEKASWRIGACMPVRRREPGLCFVDRVVLDGNLVRVGGRTQAGQDRTDVL